MNETAKEVSEKSPHVPPEHNATPLAHNKVRPEVIAALRESFVKFDELYRALARSGG